MSSSGMWRRVVCNKPPQCHIPEDGIIYGTFQEDPIIFSGNKGSICDLMVRVPE
jgi:hypothetical protein